MFRGLWLRGFCESSKHETAQRTPGLRIAYALGKRKPGGWLANAAGAIRVGRESCKRWRNYHEKKRIPFARPLAFLRGCTCCIGTPQNMAVLPIYRNSMRQLAS